MVSEVVGIASENYHSVYNMRKTFFMDDQKIVDQMRREINRVRSILSYNLESLSSLDPPTNYPTPVSELPTRLAPPFVSPTSPSTKFLDCLESAKDCSVSLISESAKCVVEYPKASLGVAGIVVVLAGKKIYFDPRSEEFKEKLGDFWSQVSYYTKLQFLTDAVSPDYSPDDE